MNSAHLVRPTRRVALAVGITAWLVVISSALAHEVRPAYLELVETATDTFTVTFKQPTLGDRRLPIEPLLPAACSTLVERQMSVEPGSITERWQVRCPGGLIGKVLAIDGLSRTMIDALVRLEPADAEARTFLLKPGRPQVTVEAQASTPVLAYLRLGIEHLLFGFDHVLFVLGLMYFVSGFGALVRTVTAFTIAHSITLALSTLGVLTLASPPVEATIALSILFLAAEALRGGRQSLAWRKPWLIAFGFGLLHGFGFAGALQDLGLPRDAVALALLLFNVGVELGQLALIVVLLAAVALFTRQPWQPRWAYSAPLVFMGVMAGWWSVERVVPIVFA